MISNELYKQYKQKITPNIFINQRHIGRNSDLKRLANSGVLEEMFPIVWMQKKKKTLEELVGDYEPPEL